MKEIKFKTDKNGRKRAYFYSRRQFRSFPMSVAEAEFEVATGQAYVVKAFLGEEEN